MQRKHILSLALALVQAVVGQSDNSRSLSDALASQNASLSVFNSVLASLPQVVSSLSSANNITLLAPNNDAMNKFISSAGPGATNNTGLLTNLLNYHVINGTYYADQIAAANGTLFVPTLLDNQSYSNVTGGQRVGVTPTNGNVIITSGLGQNSSVVTTNVNFTGGTIHIINNVLTFPTNDSDTAVQANLTALAGALTQANLVSTVDDLRDVTIFAPTNEAFNAIGNLAANLSSEQLASILEYHVVAGRVVYSPNITNGTVQAINNGTLTFTVEDGQVFVNSAKVVQPNVLVANGVVHVIDNVLNPSNSTATPNPTQSTQPPAFSGATTTTGVPFTSGVGTPTGTATVPPAGGHTSTSSGLAVPMKTGAVGAAALFGGAAMLVNL